ncbi:MAG: pyruvate kinase [Pseudomonadota bacterium]|nr:pyruvate kinase [Pseudomonadota bacterium]
MIKFKQHGKFFFHHTAVRRSKVVATIGPASASEATLKEMLESGLDIVRLNFSHGNQASHAQLITRIRQVAKQCNRGITILQDLQGPKIRCGHLIDDLQLQVGDKYKLIYGSKQTKPDIIPIDYAGVCQDMLKGQRVLMDDGKIVTKIHASYDDHVVVEVIHGGLLKSRKGVNFPDTSLSLSALTDKDSQDLLFGISQKVDIIALSFVQTADDVVQVREIITNLGEDTPIIVKVEKHAAVQNIMEIAAVSEGLMVARGDLGVEAQMERVPSFQRKIMEAGAVYGRPIIVATQMLESMIESPSASVSEINDVANAVLESADCLMMSAETASGKHPVLAVRKMVSIIEEVEKWTLTHRKTFRNTFRRRRMENLKELEVHESVAITACEACESLRAAAIVCLSLTGSIAASIAKWRPSAPIIAISPRFDVVNRLNMIWGVYSLHNPLFYKTDKLLQDLPLSLKQAGYVKAGDTIIITGGIPISLMCPTNMLKIDKIT